MDPRPSVEAEAVDPSEEEAEAAEAADPREEAEADPLEAEAEADPREQSEAADAADPREEEDEAAAPARSPSIYVYIYYLSTLLST